MALTMANVRLGLMQFGVNSEGSIVDFVVSKLFDIVDNSTFISTEGQNIDVWPSLTEGQRQQLRLIKQRIGEIIGG